MKKSTKKIVGGILIFAVTLIVGFGITCISFNLFNNMSINQMRLVFAVDIIVLLITGACAWFIYEGKEAKKQRELEFSHRHNERLKAVEKRNNELFNLTQNGNYAA